MSATATTTIPGVSLVAKHRRRHPPVFELALSQGGVEVRLPNAAPQQISWDRVQEWELEVHRAGVLLTLRGSGVESALIVPGWTVAALDEVLRDVSAPVPFAAPPAAPPVRRLQPRPAPFTAPAPAPESPPPPPAPPATRAQRRRQKRPVTWKVVTAVVLLGLVAAAVTVVLLQSAGVIHWAFLGPTG